jgi:hypothetical protein
MAHWGAVAPNNVLFDLQCGKSPVVFECKYWGFKIFKIL